jgi:hypothetical protein
MRKTIQTLAVVTIAFGMTVGLAACGSDEKSSDSRVDVTEAVTSEGAPTPTEAAPTPTDAAPVPTEAPAAPGTEAAGAAAAPAAAGNAYVLKEWTLEGSTTLASGKVELAVTNGGKFAHQFKVIKNTTYEDAPKDELGAVFEDQLPAGSILVQAEKIEPGKSATLSADLPPGKYLFVCNIEFGPNSHAGKGQRLNVTVA